MHSEFSEPEYSRKRKARARFEVGSGAHLYSQTAEDRHRQTHFEALALIVSVVSERFDQPSFTAYKNLESLLIQFLKDEGVTLQMKFVKENYSDDLSCGYLLPQLEIFKTLIKGKQINCFLDVLKEVKSLCTSQQAMISKVIQICRLLHVNPATGERSF